MNPFVFSRPVEPSEFVDRSSELRMLLGTARNGGSSLITGQPHIGKSSLLTRLVHAIEEETRANDKIIPIIVTPTHVNPDSGPLGFWNHIIGLASEATSGQYLITNLGSSFEIERWFVSLKKSGRSVVLMIDGLGWLLSHESLGTTQFWGQLRSTATRSGSLSLIATSHLTTDDIHTRFPAVRGESHGSPLLNFVDEVSLKPFSYEETIELVDKALGRSQQILTPRDKRIIWQLSGGHPFLVQLAAYMIWEARYNNESVARDNYAQLSDELINAARTHFADTWEYFSPTVKTIALMVTLREVAKDLKFNTNELDEVLRTNWGDIQKLQGAGLVRVESQETVLSGLSFGMWILRYQVGKSKDVPQPEEWLRDNKQLLGPLTRKQIETASSTLGKVYAEIRETVLDLGSLIARSRLGIP